MKPRPLIIPLLCLLSCPALAVPLPQPRPAALAPPELPEPRPKALRKPTSKSNPDQTKAIPASTPTPEAPPEEVEPLNVEEATEPTEPIPDSDCDALAQSGEAEFKLLPRITEGVCGSLSPIKLIALTPKNGQQVALEPPITTRCAIGTALVTWLKASVQPASTRHFGEPINAFQSTGGYECRSRNHLNGAKMSEHARANGIDIGFFQRVSGAKVKVGDTEEPGLAFMSEIRTAACGPFTTVLGPGADASHSEHFHFDLAKRGKNNRTTFCQ